MLGSNHFKFMVLRSVSKVVCEMSDFKFGLLQFTCGI